MIVSSGSSRNVDALGRGDLGEVHGRGDLQAATRPRGSPSGMSVGSASMLSWWVTCSSTPPSLTPGASSAPSRCTATCVWIFSSRRTSSRSMWMSSSRTGCSCWSLTITGRVLPSTLRSISAEPSTSTWRSARAFDLEGGAVAVLRRRRRRRARSPRGAGAWSRACRARGASSTSRVGRFASAMTAGQCSGGLASAGLCRCAGMAMVERGDDDTDIPKGRIRRTAQVGSVVGLAGRPLRRHARARTWPATPSEAGAGARAAPPGGRRADGRHARPHEGRGDEDRPARLLHRHRVPAAGVPRALPGQARHAAHHGAADAVEEGARGARRGVGRARSRSCSRTSSTRPPRRRRSARCTGPCCPTGGGWR